MTSLADYGKWDNIDDNEGFEPENTKPIVTRLDKPTSIVIPGRLGEQVNSLDAQYHKWDNMDAESDEDDDREYYEDDWYRQQVEEAKAAKDSATTAVVEPAALPSKSRPSSSAAERLDLSEQGVDADSYLWRQTAEVAEVSVIVPSGARARLVAVDLTRGRLTVRYDREVLLDGELLNGVWGSGDGKAGFNQELTASDEQRENNAMEWELHDLKCDPKRRRCIRIALTKRPPCVGLKCWWSKLFVDDKISVDVGAIEGRKAKADVQGVWQQAQAAFRERVASLRPSNVGIDDVGLTSKEQ